MSADVVQEFIEQVRLHAGTDPIPVEAIRFAAQTMNLVRADNAVLLTRRLSEYIKSYQKSNPLTFAETVQAVAQLIGVLYLEQAQGRGPLAVIG